MASYNELNALIDAYINRNGVQAITGQILNGVLKAMVEQLGRGYTIMGAATPTTDPGTPDGPECYFASETGTYTDFDGLQVVPGELALLCYTPSDGWTKATIYEGFREVGATIDGNVGTPSVGVSYADGVLSFDFHNMKGNPGQNGQDGAAAGFGTIGADIAGGIGTPAVSVESSGQATAKNLQFHFTNLKGETGVTSVVATVDNTTGTPACTVSLVGQQLTLAFSGLKGAQGNTGSSVDYPFTIVNNLTTDDATQALSAAQGVVLDGKVTQLEAKVYIIAPEYFGEDSKQNGQYNTNGDTLVPSATTAVKQIIDSTARAGDVYALIGQGAFSYNLWAFADADGNILSRSGGNVNALTPIRIVAPVGTTKAIFSSYYASGEKFAVLKNAIFDKDHYILDPLPGKVADNEQAIAQITDAIAVRAWVKKDTSSGQYKPTNQNTGNNGARLSNGTIAAASSSNALVTDLIEIDHTKRYKFKTVIANYFQGIAYYNNGSYIGNDVFHTTGTEQTIEAELTIPENATHFRLATAAINIAYEISTFETLYPQLATKESVDELQEDVETLQANVADLYGIAEAAGTMEVARAVRYIPTKDIYLGADIVSLQGATYDPTYWSVSGGVVKYLGGGGQSTPFVFGMVTSNGQGYLAELTASVASPGFEDLFNIKIGDGALVDTYNGTANTRGGLVSDGGSFTIVPMSTKAFDLTSAKLSPVLSSENSAGYERTVQIEVLNVTAGNSAQTLIDGKWNVAVGPTEYTMAHNVGGSRSVAIGYMALNKWNNGLQNIAIGTFAASNIEEGKYNVCIGADSMWQVKKATGNVVIGRSALGKTGEYAEVLRNVAIGYRAMANQESGAADSVTIGHNSNLYGVSRSVFIGSDCTASYANRTISNIVCIGYGARATKSNQCVLGNTLVTEFVLGNKKLVFNNDNTVSWETIS